jgi:hypothetical protein
MLVPITLLLLALLAAAIGAMWIAKKRVVDHEHPPDIRPEDRKPTAKVSV